MKLCYGTMKYVWNTYENIKRARANTFFFFALALHYEKRTINHQNGMRLRKQCFSWLSLFLTGKSIKTYLTFVSFRHLLVRLSFLGNISSPSISSVVLKNLSLLSLFTLCLCEDWNTLFFHRNRGVEPKGWTGIRPKSLFCYYPNLRNQNHV